VITLDRELLNVAKNLPLCLERYDSNGERVPPLPDQDGFVFVGAGCERTVWLGPDGNVYKIQNSSRDNANVKEYRESLRLRGNADLPSWIYIPETAYDEETKIAVAEYIRGEQPWHCYYDTCECAGSVCRWQRASEAFDHCGSNDGHAGNCVIIEGNSVDSFTVAIIDFTR
jgi:hypothetical protein